MQFEVSYILREARIQRAGPAKPLKSGWHLAEIQVRIVAAVGADDLEHVGVTAFDPAVHDPDRLAPQPRLKDRDPAGPREGPPGRLCLAVCRGRYAVLLPDHQPSRYWSRQSYLLLLTEPGEFSAAARVQSSTNFFSISSKLSGEHLTW
jgi:hypothetical protein